jgi:hypothetical protein
MSTSEEVDGIPVAVSTLDEGMGPGHRDTWQIGRGATSLADRASRPQLRGLGAVVVLASALQQSGGSAAKVLPGPRWSNCTRVKYSSQPARK